MPRAFSLSSLLRSFLLLAAVGVALAIFIVSEWAIAQTTDILSERIFDSSIEHTRSVVEGLIKPTEAQLNSAWDTLAAESLSPLDIESCANLLEPILTHNLIISSVNFAQDDGSSLMLLNENAGWLQRETRPREWGDRYRITRMGFDQSAVSEWVTGDYDPRQTPWYKRAAQRLSRESSERHHSSWSAPYEFKTTGDLGCSISQARLIGGEIHVLSFDIRLEDFRNRLRAWGEHESFSVGVWDRRSATWLAGGGLGQNISAHHLNQTQDEHSFRLQHDGQIWNVRVTRDALDDSRDFSLVVFVPQAGLMGGMEVLRNYLLGICVLVTLGLLWGLTRVGARWHKPLDEILERFNVIGQGDLTPKPALETRISEFNEVIRVQDEMRDNLNSLAGMRKDIAIARDIQARTFPSEVPELPGFELASYACPADETGGDTYDLSLVDFDAEKQRFGAHSDKDHRTALFMMLGDAAGHGIGPALIATQVRAMIRMSHELGGGMSQIVTSLNDRLSDDLPDNRFITLWLGVIDIASMTLHHFSAGQGPLLFYNAREKKVESWQADAPPFGALPDLLTDEVRQTSLVAGDCLVVLSDGFYEARNPQGEMFDVSRVAALVETNQNKTASEILERLLKALAEFCDDTPADDDRTAIVLKVGDYPSV